MVFDIDLYFLFGWQMPDYWSEFEPTGKEVREEYLKEQVFARVIAQCGTGLNLLAYLQCR